MANNDLLGHAVIEGTTYAVYALPVGPNSQSAGIRANLALEGPRGATYFVTDYGPAYKLNAIRVSRSCAPRALRGLKREHLSLFLVA